MRHPESKIDDESEITLIEAQAFRQCAIALSSIATSIRERCQGDSARIREQWRLLVAIGRHKARELGDEEADDVANLIASVASIPATAELVARAARAEAVLQAHNVASVSVAARRKEKDPNLS